MSRSTKRKRSTQTKRPVCVTHVASYTRKCKSVKHTKRKKRYRKKSCPPCGTDRYFKANLENIKSQLEGLLDDVKDNNKVNNDLISRFQNLRVRLSSLKNLMGNRPKT